MINLPWWASIPKTELRAIQEQKIFKKGEYPKLDAIMEELEAQKDNLHRWRLLLFAGELQRRAGRVPVHPQTVLLARSRARDAQREFAGLHVLRHARPPYEISLFKNTIFVCNFFVVRGKWILKFVWSILSGFLSGSWFVVRKY